MPVDRPNADRLERRTLVPKSTNSKPWCRKSPWESTPEMKLFVDMEKQSYTTYPLSVKMLSKMLQGKKPPSGNNKKRNVLFVIYCNQVSKLTYFEPLLLIFKFCVFFGSMTPLSLTVIMWRRKRGEGETSSTDKLFQSYG